MGVVIKAEPINVLREAFVLLEDCSIVLSVVTHRNVRRFVHVDDCLVSSGEEGWEERKKAREEDACAHMRVCVCACVRVCVRACARVSV